MDPFADRREALCLLALFSVFLWLSRVGLTGFVSGDKRDSGTDRGPPWPWLSCVPPPGFMRTHTYRHNLYTHTHTLRQHKHILSLSSTRQTVEPSLHSSGILCEQREAGVFVPGMSSPGDPLSRLYSAEMKDQQRLSSPFSLKHTNTTVSPTGVRRVQ